MALNSLSGSAGSSTLQAVGGSLVSTGSGTNTYGIATTLTATVGEIWEVDLSTPLQAGTYTIQLSSGVLVKGPAANSLKLIAVSPENTQIASTTVAKTVTEISITTTQRIRRFVLWMQGGSIFVPAGTTVTIVAGTRTVTTTGYAMTTRASATWASASQILYTVGTDKGGIARASNDKFYAIVASQSAGTNGAFWEYDPGANAWTQKANFPTNINGHSTSFIVAVGSLIYAGGGRYWNGTSYINNTGWASYDPSTNTWTSRASYGGDNGWYGGTTIYNGTTVMVMGGRTSGNSATNFLGLYNVAGNSWTYPWSLSSYQWYQCTGFYNSTDGYTYLWSYASGVIDIINAALTGEITTTNNYLSDNFYGNNTLAIYNNTAYAPIYGTNSVGVQAFQFSQFTYPNLDSSRVYQVGNMSTPSTFTIYKPYIGVTSTGVVYLFDYLTQGQAVASLDLNATAHRPAYVS